MSRKGLMPDSRIEGAGQSKVRMMKAGLPEFQFPVATRGAVAKADDTPRRAGRVLGWGGTRRRHARNSPRRGNEETNGTSARTATPQARNFGIACSRPSPGPVWRRSRHSTQTPGVTAGTAAHGRTAMRIRSGRSDRKRPPHALMDRVAAHRAWGLVDLFWPVRHTTSLTATERPPPPAKISGSPIFFWLRANDQMSCA